MSFYGNIFNKFQNAFNKIQFETTNVGEDNPDANEIIAQTSDETLTLKNDATLKWTTDSSGAIIPQVNTTGFSFERLSSADTDDYNAYVLTRDGEQANADSAMIKIPKIKILDSVNLVEEDGKVVLKLQFNVDNDESASAEEIIQLSFADSSTINLSVQDIISDDDKSGIIKAEIINDSITVDKLNSSLKRCVIAQYIEGKDISEHFQLGLQAANIDDISNPVDGNIVIIEKAIADEKTSRTAYVYNNGEWKALDGNYNANNVYLDSDLIITANIGVQTLGNASFKTLNTSGKSVKQVMSMILAKEEAPSINSQPSVITEIGINSSTADKAITVEGGSTITPYWKATFNKGAYKYGPDTGLEPTKWYIQGAVVKGTTTTVPSNHIGLTASGSMPDITLDAGSSYVINARATYEDAPLAWTNLGEEYKAGNALFDETAGATSVQITGGSKHDDSKAITAWQQGYYIGTLESDIEITSDVLRNVGSGAGLLKNRKTKGGNYAAQTDLVFSPTGTMAKFVIAYPASIDSTNSSKGLSSFFNNSAFEEYKNNFSRSIVKVAGADNDIDSEHAIDYAVWTWVPDSPFSGTINFLIDLK